MKKNIEIIFEDADFIAINKPYGLLSIPARGSLVSDANVYTLLQKKYGNIYIVHRLDKETSGVMVMAKTKEAHLALCEIFEKRNIEKKYIALVYGILKNDYGEINKRIKEFSSGRSAISFEGKDSVTFYKVLKKFNNFSFLELDLKTGRRHQIRVHLYSIGHPVVGDTLYGNLKEQRKYPRLMLHSYKLSFEYKNRKYNFVAEPDEEFYQIIELLS